MRQRQSKVSCKGWSPGSLRAALRAHQPPFIQPEAEAAHPRCLSVSGMMLRAVQQMWIRVRTGKKKIIPELSARRTVGSLSSTEVLYPAPVM